jgi:hypothetical protein
MVVGVGAAAVGVDEVVEVRRGREAPSSRVVVVG